MGNASSELRKRNLGSKLTDDGLLCERNINIRDKYEELEFLGRGSIGYVVRARVRDGQEGGSAFPVVSPKKEAITDQLDKVPETLSTSDNTKNTTSKGALRSSMQRRKHKVEYAIKTFRLDRMSSNPKEIEALANSIDILRSADHPNIVKAYEVFSHVRQMHLVMELCDGGNLYARLPYTEKQVANIVGKLCSAVRYMHKHGIVHRDLKFENILFENTNKAAEIKIIGFGMGRKFGYNQKISSLVMYEKIGSIVTMAPEVIKAAQDGYTSQADMWAVGVVTYMLLGDGMSPFVSHKIISYYDVQQMIGRILHCQYNFEEEKCSNFSKKSKYFIKQLLEIDPTKRMTAKQALDHTWLSKEFHPMDKLSRSTSSKWVEEHLKHYQHKSALKKVALNVIAHKSSAKDILFLRNLFYKYDKNKNGVISFSEFKSALKQSKYTYEEIDKIFQSIDVNLDGYINYTEFIAASLEARGDIEEERVAEAFDRIDLDDSGYITKKNLMDILGHDAFVDDQEITDVIKASDKDMDGKISWEEFIYMFQKGRNVWMYDDLQQKCPTVEKDKFYLSDTQQRSKTIAGNECEDDVEQLDNWIKTVQNPLARCVLRDMERASQLELSAAISEGSTASTATDVIVQSG